ncbi:hypothetical protein F4678DRAFT_52068 [Xylaria arbuscula]|nr:hypothetical protein F4678DRAFT_52068 [Xylaria arbuscula]
MSESRRASDEEDARLNPIEKLSLIPGPRSPRHSKFHYFGHLTDLILIIIAVGFIVFALLVYASDNRPMTAHSREEALLVAASYGPTIFPIVFAAIVGRTLKSIATWKLQRGTTIGRVEQLLGSHTIVGSIVTQIELRTFGLVAIIIVVLWSLSPLGSQASLRIARVETKIIQSQHPITMLNPDSIYTTGEFTGDLQGSLPMSLFSNALVSSTVLAGKTQDAWGGLRIPMIEVFDNYTNGDWISLPANGSETVFSSILGVPYNSTLSVGTSTFTVNTSYMTLDCPVFETLPVSKWTNFSDVHSAPRLENKLNSWYAKWVMLKPATGTALGSTVAPNGFRLGVTTCLVGCAHLLTSEEIQKPREARRLIWESPYLNGTDHVDCTVHTTYVDVNYTCSNPSQCDATGVRLSHSLPQPSIFSSFNFPKLDRTDPWLKPNFTSFDRGSFTDAVGLIELLTTAFTLHDSGTMSPVMGYLISPNDPFSTETPYDWKGMASLGRKTFETRFAQIINTQYIGGIAPRTSIGVDPLLQTDDNLSPTLLETTATTGVGERFFVCDKGWFSAVFIISVIVLVTAAVGAVLRRLTLVPDVLGTLSVGTLDNRCERLPTKGTMLSGLERARYMKGIGIRLGDVEPSQPVGRIALVAPLQDVPAGIVESWREYE